MGYRNDSGYLGTPGATEVRVAFSPAASARARDTLRHDVRAFIAEERASDGFQPHCDAWLTGFDPRFSRRLATRGWVGMTMPARYGGSGASPADRFAVVEELLAAGAPVAAHWFAERQVGPAILRHGTGRQRDEWLPRITSAEAFFAIGLSEPDAGSDLASVRTRATPVTGGWRIDGTKIWSSGAHAAHAIVVLARSGEGGRRSDGLTQFIVRLPDPAVAVSPIISLSGQHHFNEVVFDGVFVPDEMVLGEPGNGWAQVIEELAYERSGPERFLSTMPLLEELRRSVQGAGAAVAQDLGSLLSSLVPLREMSRSVADSLASGSPPVVAAALVKDLGTTFEQASVGIARAASSYVSIPNATVFGQILNEAQLQSPNFTLRGGTSEVLRNIVARELMRETTADHPPGAHSLIDESVGAVLALAGPADGPALDPAWQQLVKDELPWAGIAESIGGPGGDEGEQAAVLTAVAGRGRSVPIAETGFVGGWILERAGWPLDRRLVLPALAFGRGGALATARSPGWSISGTFPCVPWGRHADELLILADRPDGSPLVARLSAGQWVVRPGENPAGEPGDAVSFQDAFVSDSDVCPVLAADVIAVLARAGLARAIMMSAAMESVLRMTARYSRQRHQFGRPISEFQAVAHRLSRMAGETEAARAAVTVALRSRNASAAAVAKARASRAAVIVAEDAHQVHGAMGVSAEYPLGRLTTRLWSWASDYGDERYWNRWLGRQLLADTNGLWTTVVSAGRGTG
jgi:alkylation response protein AidB-like acyl-CoA dehydrogenase